MTWNYSNTSVQTTLSAPITSSDATLTIADSTGLPVTYPFSLILDYQAATVEVVTVTGPSGGAFAVTRGQDGTSAQSHSAGAVVVHGVVARDVQEPQNHIGATSNIHGVGASSAIVGTATTQTLTNKSVDGTTNTLTNIPSSAITSLASAKVTQPFTSVQVTPGSASTTALTVTANEASRSVPVASVVTQNNSVLIDEDGTVDLDRGDLSIDAARAHGAAALASRLFVKATGKIGSIVKKAVVSDSYDLVQWQKEDGTIWGRVDSSGQLNARRLIAKPQSGDTADLLNLQNSSGTDKAKVDKDGNLTAVAGTFSGAVSTGALSAGATTVTGTATVSSTASVTGNITAGADVTVTGDVYKSGETSWHALTLLNGFSNKGAGYPAISYRRVSSPPKHLEIVGTIVSGTTTTSGTLIATLPLGYRPTTQQGHAAINFLSPLGLMALILEADGSLNLFGAWSNLANIYINARFPLDL